MSIKKTIKFFANNSTYVIIKMPGEFAFSQNMATRTKKHRERCEYGVECLCI